MRIKWKDPNSDPLSKIEKVERKIKFLVHKIETVQGWIGKRKGRDDSWLKEKVEEYRGQLRMWTRELHRLFNTENDLRYLGHIVGKFVGGGDRGRIFRVHDEVDGDFLGELVHFPGIGCWDVIRPDGSMNGDTYTSPLDGFRDLIDTYNDLVEREQDEWQHDVEEQWLEEQNRHYDKDMLVS